MSDQEATQTAQPTAGEWLIQYDGPSLPIIATAEEVIALAKGLDAEANARLMVTACNAAQRLNPANPLAAAQSMERVVKEYGLTCDRLEALSGRLKRHHQLEFGEQARRIALDARAALDAMRQDGAG